MSLRIILKGRKLLGWTFCESAHCQRIHIQNKEKRLEWAETYLQDGFEDVVWTDKTTVKLETHRHFCCRENGQKPHYKPPLKHPVKVHVWARSSWKGCTEIHLWGNHECWDVYWYFSSLPGAIHSKFVSWRSPIYARQPSQAHLTSCPCILCRTQHQLVQNNPQARAWTQIQLKICGMNWRYFYCV